MKKKVFVVYEFDANEKGEVTETYLNAFNKRGKAEQFILDNADKYHGVLFIVPRIITDEY